MLPARHKLLELAVILRDDLPRHQKSRSYHVELTNVWERIMSCY